MKWGVAILWMACGHGAFAQAYYVTASQLAQDCRDEQNHTPGRHSVDDGICFGYIQGTVDTFQHLDDLGWAKKGMSICVPPGTSTGQLVAMFVKFADSHPQFVDERPAPQILWDTFEDDFYCHFK